MGKGSVWGRRALLRLAWALVRLFSFEDIWDALDNVVEEKANVLLLSAKMVLLF